MRQQNSFNDLKENLQSSDVDQLVELLGHRCRLATVQKLRRRLELTPNLVPSFGILERLTLEGGRWSYCAGQSYVDEIRIVRSIILSLK